MNVLRILILTMLIPLSTVQAQNLSDYQWKNRILILSDTDEQFSNATPAVTTMSKYTEELEERDFLVLLYKGGIFYTIDFEKTSIKSNQSIPDDFNGYLLIGKDGGVKTRAPYPIVPEELFSLVDGMPMRRAEIQSNH